jgi:hypothetical protein
MLRQALMCIHGLFALGLAWTIVMGPKGTGPVATLPMLLVFGVAWGLIARRRWVIVPSVILAMLALALAGMLVFGGLTWVDSALDQLLLACGAFLGLETSVIILGWKFGRDESPAVD